MASRNAKDDGQTPREPEDDVLAQLLARRTQVARLEQELADVHASTSWRVTGPLRWLSSLWRRRSSEPEPPRTGQRRLAPSCIAEAWIREDAEALAGEDSARVVDAVPLCAGLFSPDELDLLRSPPESGSASLCRDRDAPRLGFIGTPQLGLEIAFDFPLVIPDPEQPPTTYPAPPLLLLEVSLAPSRHRWSGAFESEGTCRDRLRALVEHFRAGGTRVAIWLRVEPQEVEQIAGLLALADALFATSAAVCARVSSTSSMVCEVMQGMVQPRLHNPVATPALRKSAGCLQQACLADALTEHLQAGSGDDGVASATLWSESYWDVPASRLLDGAVDRERVLGVLREVDKIALFRTVSGVVQGPSRHRPAWWTRAEALKAAACGRLVALGPGRDEAVDVPFLDPALLATLLDGERSGRRAVAAAAWRLRASREAAARFSVRHSLQRVAAALGVAGFDDHFEPVSCLLTTMRPHLLGSALRQYVRQTYPAKELVVVVHGAGRREVLDCQGLARAAGVEARVLAAPTHYGLGDCLDRAIDAASGSSWFKFDDDDEYGPHYVSDLVRLMQSTDAALAAKPLTFTRFESDGATFCDPEGFALANLLYCGAVPPGSVCGATLAGRMDVARSIRFSGTRRHGVDSQFLKASGEAGHRLVAGDAFNFTCVRAADPARHTWQGNEAVVRQRGFALSGDAGSSGTVDL